MTTNSGIAVLGGTFNPPHKGHILPALQAIKELGVTRLGLMPCKIPPHKSVAGISEQHRVNMITAVCSQSDVLYPELIELSLPSPSYTVRTLRELRREYPNSPLYFLIGYDSLYNLASWYEWQQLTDYCHLVVMKRNSDELKLSPMLNEFVDARREHSPETLSQRTHGNIYFANTALQPVSSTEIRDSVYDAGASVRPAMVEQWLEPAVIDYIYENKLYQITE